MLQYWFDGPPVDVQVKPHGNSKSTVPLKCNVALTRMYFPRSSILDTLLSTSTRTNSTRVERGGEADVKDSIVELNHSSEFALSLE